MTQSQTPLPTPGNYRQLAPTIGGSGDLPPATVGALMRWGTVTTDDIAATLPMATRQYFERFGVQLLMDVSGKSVGRMKKMLVCASSFSLSEVVNRITNGFGLAIAAHTNRT